MRYATSVCRPHALQCRGFTYVEVLLTVTISAILVASLMGVVNTAIQTGEDVGQRNDLTRQARFAMQSMVRNVSHSHKLVLPLNDNPATNWPENIREQTFPASAPVGSSVFATAVLGVTLPLDVDLDDNGLPDADNDGDGQIDEDMASDSSNDGTAGLFAIDDNGDGYVDDSTASFPERDDDEDDARGEDVLDGIDNDNDGTVDEDPRADMNDDGQPGISGVDEDGDGTLDEGDKKDDDEDGSVNEDWLDVVVFYLQSGVLKQRLPVPWDTDADSDVDGRDTIISDIAENVSRFRIERVPQMQGKPPLLDITLELTDPVSSEVISLHTRIRIGGAL